MNDSIEVTGHEYAINLDGRIVHGRPEHRWWQGNSAAHLVTRSVTTTYGAWTKVVEESTQPGDYQPEPGDRVRHLLSGAVGTVVKRSPLGILAPEEWIAVHWDGYGPDQREYFPANYLVEML